MKVTHKSLKSALKFASAVISKSPIPVLESVSLRLDGAALKVRATNLDAYATTWSPIVSASALDVCVNANALTKALTAFKLDAVLELGTMPADNDAGQVFTISSATARCTLAITGTSVDFPETPATCDQLGVKLDADSIETIKRKFAPIAEKDGSVLSGVNFQPLAKSSGETEVYVACTDGSRLITGLFPSGHDAAAASFTIPANIVALLPVEPVHISLDSGGIWAKLSTIQGIIETRLLSGVYPRVDGIIPETTEGYRVYDRHELITALNAITKHDKTKRAVFVGLQVGSFDGELRYDLTGHSSDKRVFTVNSRLLLDWAKEQKTEQVKITFAVTSSSKLSDIGVLKPLMLEDDSPLDYSVKHLLMPISNYCNKNKQVICTWARKQAQSIEQSGGYSKADEPKITSATKPAQVKRKTSAAPAPEIKQVTVNACAHLRKLIKDHQLSCRDCNCIIASL